MNDISKELIQDTIKQWSPKAGYTLSEDEAIEIITNLTNYFETLNEIAIKITKDTSKELIDEGNFVQVKDADKLIPDETGLYCIRLIKDSKLPDATHVSEVNDCQFKYRSLQISSPTL